MQLREQTRELRQPGGAGRGAIPFDQGAVKVWPHLAKCGVERLQVRRRRRRLCLLGEDRVGTQPLRRGQRRRGPGIPQVIDGRQQAQGREHGTRIQAVQMVGELNQGHHHGLGRRLGAMHRPLGHRIAQLLHLLEQACRGGELQCEQHAAYLEQGLGRIAQGRRFPGLPIGVHQIGDPAQGRGDLALDPSQTTTNLVYHGIRPLTCRQGNRKPATESCSSVARLTSASTACAARRVSSAFASVIPRMPCTVELISADWRD